MVDFPYCSKPQHPSLLYEFVLIPMSFSFSFPSISPQLPFFPYTFHSNIKS